MVSRERIDALPPSRRLTGLSRELVSRQLDDELQAIVADAAAQVGAPIALVSMVLDNVQFFRAHHGLPDDLAAVRATARDVSFCQFVVRDDDLLEIEDARDRPDLPQALVDAYGIRAYLGAPIHLDGQPLGSLCVIDTEPRTFTVEERALITILAQDVEARISQWSQPMIPSLAVTGIIAPVLAEIRNHLSPLLLTSDELHLLHVELSAHVAGLRLGGTVQAALPDLAVLGRKLAIVGEAAGRVNDATVGVADGVSLIEGLMDLRRLGADASEIAARVATLTTSMTDTMGGLAWAPVPEQLRVAMPLPVATVTLIAALNGLIGLVRPRPPRGLMARVIPEGPSIIFEFSSPVIVPADAAVVATALEAARYGSTGVVVEAGPESVRVRLPKV